MGWCDIFAPGRTLSPPCFAEKSKPNSNKSGRSTSVDCSRTEGRETPRLGISSSKSQILVRSQKDTYYFERIYKNLVNFSLPPLRRWSPSQRLLLQLTLSQQSTSDRSTSRGRLAFGHVLLLSCFHSQICLKRFSSGFRSRGLRRCQRW